jgi:hypothetical protein
VLSVRAGNICPDEVVSGSHGDVFWDVVACSVINIDRRFRGAYCRNQKGIYSGQMKMTVFWDVGLCSLVGTDRRFRGAYCLHNQGIYSGQIKMDVFRDVAPDVSEVLTVSIIKAIPILYISTSLNRPFFLPHLSALLIIAVSPSTCLLSYYFLPCNPFL